MAFMTDLGRFKSEFFKALAHPLRIAVLDELRNGETGVNDLCTRLGVEQSSLSQQLAVLRIRTLSSAARTGPTFTTPFATRPFQLLDVAKQIFNNHLIDVKSMLAEMNVQPSIRRR